MKLIIQRVSKGKITSNGALVSEIGPGIFAQVGITTTDNEVDADNLIDKILKLKLWQEWKKNVKDMNY